MHDKAMPGEAMRGTAGHGAARSKGRAAVLPVVDALFKTAKDIAMSWLQIGVTWVLISFFVFSMLDAYRTDPNKREPQGLEIPTKDVCIALVAGAFAVLLLQRYF